ncbi:MAG: mannitol dehydrogenase family protein [Solirubrobacteraceae bacterium]
MAGLRSSTLHALSDRIPVPAYDRAAVRTGIVHVGVGGFHRAHLAVYHDELLARGDLDWGICGVGVLPADVAMRDALRAQDGLYTLIVKHPDGRCDARVIGSLVEYLLAPEDPEAVIEKMAAPATHIVSLTITEGGYSVDDVTGAFDPSAPDIAADLAGDGPPRTAFGLIVEALARRRERGVAPFTVLSCDNLEGNGDIARTALASFAWLREPALGEWVEREVPFPNSVVDRITPATTDADRALLRDRFGVEDLWPVVCEPFCQWVIEDPPRPRPSYEAVGATVLADVRPHELMKLRMLNAGHQAIAYFGMLCGHEFVDEAVGDPLIGGFLEGYLRDEAAPSLEGVSAREAADYQRTLLTRFANPGVRDRLARLAVDASDRIPKFLLPVVRERLATGGDVRRCAAVVASWARYADGFDEQGEPVEVIDRRRGRLRTLARRQPRDLDAFLGEEAGLGDLASDERFAAPYRAALASLYARGARATLAELA